jgi:indolepyruvate ferredoxin oxidoreductase beta subunit
MAPDEKSIWNLVIASVGGQGAITLNAVLGRAAAKAGVDIVTAETHGMAQRYGRVTIHVRLGPEVHGPLIPAGGADVLLGLEPLETLRSLEYCSKETLVLMNRQVVRPPSLALSWRLHYPPPEDIERKLRETAGEVLALEAHRLAREAGSALAMNTVMLGALPAATELPVPEEILEEALLETVPPKARSVNRRAFEMGRAWAYVAQR